MNRAIVRGPFSATVSILEGIKIFTKNGAVEFSASVSQQLEQLLVSVMGVESFPLLPARLETTPFECRFNTKREIELRVMGQSEQKPGVVFSFRDGDDLIGIVKQATSKFIDKTTIKGKRPASVAFSIPDIPVEGR